MAEATVQTANSKQLGKQLRSVRRKKGLSLSEVARGAGLSRRELVAYERGKVEIPPSDLWVLAGSCGVDVADLMPVEEAPALAAGPSTMEDTISQLRAGNDTTGLGRHLDTLYALRALPAGSKVELTAQDREAITDALGSDPKTLEAGLAAALRVNQLEAARLRELILPEAPRYSPLALDAGPSVASEVPDAAPTAPGESVTAPMNPETITDPRDLVPGEGTSAFEAETPAGLVDVFEELARLPEPAPLTADEFTGDLFADPPEPAALPVNAEVSGAGTFAEWQSFRSALPSPIEVAPGEPATGEPTLVESTIVAAAGAEAFATFGASDAPPIDVAARTPASDWGTGWSADTSGGDGGSSFTDVKGDGASVDELPSRVPSAWSPAPNSWDPPADFSAATTDTAPEVDRFGFGPGDGTSWGQPARVEIVEYVDEYVDDSVVDAAPSTWGTGTSAPETVVDAPWSTTDTDTATTTAAPENGTAPWDHRPDPEATNSGFYVDWGTEDDDTTTDAVATGAGETTIDVAPLDAAAAPDIPFEIPEALRADVGVDAPVAADAWAPTEAWTPTDGWTVAPDTEPLAGEEPSIDDWAAPVFESAPVFETPLLDTTVEPATPTPAPEPEPAVDGFAPISWRPLGASASPEEIAVATASILETITATEAPAPEPLAVTTEPEPTWVEPALPAPVAPTVEQFTTAGSEWELGNALPLVEVRNQGGLVMRRADERWALADVTTAENFVLEVDIDFRTGPGFGVLFHASTDAAGHMSGFSFDVDPIHEGGSYLVRQWQADRELWNPIARVAATDPSSMHGTLALRVVVIAGRLSASVNGDEVLTVDSLAAACEERHREPAQGDRVGIQAWSSSDLEVTAVRVAPR
ncbi:MAG: helix-turn-helix transcriptional regulator [Acidimicrobiia bacterium]